MNILPFDNRDGTIWMNGELTPWRDATTHVLNHGLHYGGAVFEGERVYNGKVFELEEHGERLKKSAELLDFSLPYTPAQLNDAVMQVVRAQKIENGYVRRLAWRGSEMMAISAQHNSIHCMIAAWEWPNMYKASGVKAEGIKMQTAKWKRPSPETAPCASKAAGLYMICTMSKHAAERAGCHDALMLDWRGYIAEATGANIFLVMDNGEIHTPLPDCFLDGITRRTVIGLLKDKGHKVVERHIQPEELANVKEVFLTGTAAEVTLVQSIDAQEFELGEVGAWVKQAYADLVRA
jgi:branched-chain amino acid aminotransferase